MKAQCYPEYAAILYAARRLRRPVKWCNTRMESFLSDSAGRDGILEGELALDAKGNSSHCECATSSGSVRTRRSTLDLLDNEYEELPVERLSHPGDLT